MPALVRADGTTPLRREASYAGDGSGRSLWPGASRGRAFRDWRVSAGSADADNNGEVDISAFRGRDLDRSEGVIYGAIQTQIQSIVGSGLQAVPTPDWVTLGKSKKWADAWSRVVRNKFRNWSNTSDCDASRTESLGFMAGELLTSTIISGSGVAVPYYIPENGLTRYGTCFRIVEADRVCNPNFGADTDSLRRGIHIDPETGAPIGYWLCTRHPGDALGLLASGVPREWIYIKAFTPWGRRRLIHVYPRRRPEQSTGISQLATVGGEIRDIGKIRRAELRNQVVTSALSLIVNSSLPPEAIVQMFSSPKDYWETYYDEETRPILDDGATILAPPGTKVEGFNGARNAQNFDSFLKTAWRQVMSGLDVPYEVGARDYANLNYSNARTILLDAWRTFLTKRTWLGQKFYDPVFQAWFEEAVHLGEIPDCTPDDLYAPGMATAWTACRWIGPGKGWIDPLKEAQAQTARMANGTTSMELECAEQGLDWQENAEQIRAEMDFYDELNLPYPPALLAKAGIGGAPHANPNAPTDEPKER